MIHGDDRIAEIREDFPGFAARVYGKPLVYLDNAATNQVPQIVIDAVSRHMTCESANTHRGIHYLSEQATLHFEQARNEIAAYIGAKESDCVVFNSGTTAGVNTVALGLEARLMPEDALLVTQMEHHSNYIPWQQLCRRSGAEFRVAPLDENGDVDREAFRKLLADGRVTIAAFANASNVTGAVNPVKEMVAEAHGHGALCLVDGAQGIRNGAVNVADLGCDFFCFSAHKMAGPTGVGVLYGKREALEGLEPRVFGGGTVDGVEPHASIFSSLPFRLEAGTPNIAGVAGLRAAAAYLNEIGTEWISRRERDLTAYLRNNLLSVEGVRILGTPRSQSGACSFTIEGRHPYDLASVLDKAGVATRAGHHCAIPCLRHFGEEAALRMSPAFYNTAEEIDAAVAALRKAIEFFARWGG
jgi:cysteine desulfurase/selenocysteine lyase